MSKWMAMLALRSKTMQWTGMTSFRTNAYPTEPKDLVSLPKKIWASCQILTWAPDGVPKKSKSSLSVSNSASILSKFEIDGRFPREGL